MTKLVELYDEYKNKIGDSFFTDKWLPHHSYLEYYDNEFSPYKNKVKLLEIGVCHGGSMFLWTKYFNNYDLTGVDISDHYFNAALAHFGHLKEDANISLNLSVDSKSADVANSLFADNLFDIIIEDGDHSLEAQFETFKAYFPKLKSTGAYYIEDVLDFNKEPLIEQINSYTDQVIIDVPNITKIVRGDDIIIKIIRK